MRIDFNQAPQAAPEPERNSTSAASDNASSSEVQAGKNRSSEASAAQARPAQDHPIEDPPLEDQAQLSGAHAQVQALAAQASQLPEVRHQRVESLRQAIVGGQYRADSQQVAGAIVDHMIFNQRQAA